MLTGAVVFIQQRQEKPGHPVPGESHCHPAPDAKVRAEANIHCVLMHLHVCPWLLLMFLFWSISSVSMALLPPRPQVPRPPIFHLNIHTLHLEAVLLLHLSSSILLINNKEEDLAINNTFCSNCLFLFIQLCVHIFNIWGVHSLRAFSKLIFNLASGGKTFLVISLEVTVSHHLQSTEYACSLQL